MTPSPQRLTSILFEYIWGGRKLASKYGKGDGIHTRIAEAWENCETLENSSVVLKWIDTDLPTSVHVHPSENGNEIWIVVETEPESRIGIGFNKSVSRKEILCSLREKTLHLLINNIEPKAGDCFVIPPGTIHYIDGGVTLLEITPQENTTFRLYDWQRDTATDRTIQVIESLEAMSFVQVTPSRVHLPCQEKAFQVSCDTTNVALRWREITEKMVSEDSSEVHLVTFLSGLGVLDRQEKFFPGETVLLPNRKCELGVLSGQCVALETCIGKGVNITDL